MQLQDAIRLRRSTAPVDDRAPQDRELRALLQLAAHAPDHAALRPWRLVTVRGEDRRRLGEAMAAGFGDPAGSQAAVKTAAKTSRAPLLVGVLVCYQDHPKVPPREQLAATVAMVTTLQLLLFEAGWTAMWRSGPPVELAEVQAAMGVGSDEQLLGWLYIGATAAGGASSAEPEDLGARLRPMPGPAYSA
ncbi:nitroreductase [Jatrophihabitans telluris]|uniref:Putative NAD(P)H nitroreductase n=1 Tax=Jatrophihabitans telluris TaxID=2038343 RepID=A0ABY4R439_9ACTN|nr:nitroreductase [Jatrophihabitans telluris]UQX90157.1 nitroreductase [Jatrophihabitans telluris]